MTATLSNLVATGAADVVGVFDIDFKQVFPDSAPIKASINENATFFKHPLESSATRVDHIIFNPNEIELSVLLTGGQYRNSYKQIKQIYRNQTQLIVQTRTDSYENMYIQSMPHDETSDAYDAIIVSIGLTETQVSGAVVSFQPLNPANSNTADGGQKEPDALSSSDEDNGTVLSRLFK